MAALFNTKITSRRQVFSLSIWVKIANYAHLCFEGPDTMILEYPRGDEDGRLSLQSTSTYITKH